MKRLILVLTCLVPAFACQARVSAKRAVAGRIITVDDDGPADFNNIQAAIDDANDGDVVVVADGVYTGDGNRDIDFQGKAITIKSESGPRACIIDCQGSESEPHRGFHFHSGEDTNSILWGVSIVSGYAELGGGILCDQSSPRIIGCIVSGNKAVVDGGGICIWCPNPCQNPWISNCIFFRNEADRNGGGVFCAADWTANINNCTIVNNHAKSSGGGIGFGVGGKAAVVNTILWENRAASGTQVACVGCLSQVGCMTVSLNYCWIEPGLNRVIAEPWGCLMEHIIHLDHMMSDDPLLVATIGSDHESSNMQSDPEQGFRLDSDYHLKSQAGRWDPNSKTWVKDEVTSPCIDAGDPKTPIGHEPFPNGGRINMGAYGGTPEASKSYFGEPVCETIVAGDINGDCKVDHLDFALLAGHWLEARLPAARER